MSWGLFWFLCVLIMIKLKSVNNLRLIKTNKASKNNKKIGMISAEAFSSSECFFNNRIYTWKALSKVVLKYPDCTFLKLFGKGLLVFQV